MRETTEARSGLAVQSTSLLRRLRGCSADGAVKRFTTPRDQRPSCYLGRQDECAGCGASAIDDADHGISDDKALLRVRARYRIFLQPQSKMPCPTAVRRTTRCRRNDGRCDFQVVPHVVLMMVKYRCARMTTSPKTCATMWITCVERPSHLLTAWKRAWSLWSTIT